MSAALLIFAGLSFYGAAMDASRLWRVLLCIAGLGWIAFATMFRYVGAAP